MELPAGRADAVTDCARLLAYSYAGWMSDARRGLYPLIKRAVDVIASALGLAVVAPLLILLALCIRVDSPGPVFFGQMRVGRHGRPFRCWKLRTMYTDAEARKQVLEAVNEMRGGTTFKMKRDPRVTRVGRFLRKASIDEMPQLWNVLRGDMTLVGPRPPVPTEVAQYTPRDRKRLSVKPGITCIWQVTGRSHIPFAQQVELDIEYISKRSLALDLRLLLATVPAVLFARGAY